MVPGCSSGRPCSWGHQFMELESRRNFKRAKSRQKVLRFLQLVAVTYFALMSLQVSRSQLSHTQFLKRSRNILMAGLSVSCVPSRQVLAAEILTCALYSILSRRFMSRPKRRPRDRQARWVPSQDCLRRNETRDRARHRSFEKIGDAAKYRLIK
jgi:hypothetical protein